MYKITDIKSVHLEASSFCNAACPVCNRNVLGGPTAGWFPQKEIKLEQVRSYFPESLIGQLESFLFCGNYGDPAMASELVAMCDWLKRVNPSLSVSINTNAGVRNTDFWSSLGKILHGNSFVTFSVDGLEDTNHIYRRNVKWEKVIAAMEAFRSAGGRAHWEFLVFRHNQHQIEEAKKLSEKLGFERFYAKKAFGFFHHGGQQRISVYKKDGEFDYYIYPPEEQYTNKQFFSSKEVEVEDRPQAKLTNIDGFYKKDRKLDLTMPMDSEYESKLNKCSIDCYSVKRSEIFVSVEGLVFPCCFMASKYYGYNREDYINRQLQSFMDAYGKEAHSLAHLNLEQILKGELFMSAFPNSWKASSIRSGKLAVCADFCGSHNVGLEEVIKSKTDQY